MATFISVAKQDGVVEGGTGKIKENNANINNRKEQLYWKCS